MLMASEALPPMTLDHLTGTDAEPSCAWPHAKEGGSWYLLLIEPQQEVRVSVTLNSYKVQNYLPMVPHITTRGVRRTKITAYRPMMRGYLLVAGDALDAFDGVQRRRPLPVHGFLRFGDHVATVSECIIRRLRHIEEELGKPKSVQSIWSVGEVARISDGPFWGLNCVVTDLANGTRITVEVPLLGRKVPMSIDETFLEKL